MLFDDSWETLIMIGVALDSGSGMAGRTFSPIQLEINRKFDEVWPGYFTDDIEECVLAFRVSGDIADFGFTGVDKTRLRKRPSRITVDIGVAEAQWQKRPEHEVRELTATLATAGLRKILSYLEENGHSLPDANQVQSTLHLFESIRSIS